MIISYGPKGERVNLEKPYYDDELSFAEFDRTMLIIFLDVKRLISECIFWVFWCEPIFHYLQFHQFQPFPKSIFLSLL